MDTQENPNVEEMLKHAVNISKWMFGRYEYSSARIEEQYDQKIAADELMDFWICCGLPRRLLRAFEHDIIEMNREAISLLEAELFWKEVRLRLLEDLPEPEAGEADIKAFGSRLTGRLAKAAAEDFLDQLTDKKLKAKLAGYINRNPRVFEHYQSFSREKFWRRNCWS